MCLPHFVLFAEFEHTSVYVGDMKQALAEELAYLFHSPRPNHPIILPRLPSRLRALSLGRVYLECRVGRLIYS